MEMPSISGNTPRPDSFRALFFRRNRMSRKEILRNFFDKRDYMDFRIQSGIETNRKGSFFLNF